MIVKITLPKDAHIIGKEGTWVDFQTPLYKKENGRVEKVNIAQAISAPPNKIFNYLIKFVGEKIKKGELLAVKKSFFSEKKCVAQQAGIIKEINHQDGTLLIKTLTKNKTNYPSFFKGTIKKIKDKTLEVDLKNGYRFPLREVSQDFGGKVFYLKNIKETKVLSEKELKNKIIITYQLDNYSSAKFSALDISGCILESKKNFPLSFNYGLIKKLDDLEKIFAYNLSSCLVLKNKKELILYE